MSEIVSIDEKIKKIKSQLASLENKKKEMIAKEQLKLSQAISDLIKTNNDFRKAQSKRNFRTHKKTFRLEKQW